jgi:hypothetical protein
MTQKEDDLNRISKLESGDGWTKWNREMTDYIKIQGYGDLLHRNADAPEREKDESNAEFNTRKNLWEDRQERVISAILSRVDILAREDIEANEAVKTTKEVLEQLKKHFQPLSSTLLMSLVDQFNSLSLSQCSNVTDFAQKLRTARRDLLELDKSCVIGEPLFTYRFLNGLGPKYTSFIRTFDQTTSLLPNKRLPHATFSDVLSSAIGEEGRQKAGETGYEEPINTTALLSARVQTALLSYRGFTGAHTARNPSIP